MTHEGVSWARIMAPVIGGAPDVEVLAVASRLAEPFGAEMAAVYAPADVADVMPWMGEGFMGGVQITAVETLREAAAEGERVARGHFDACPCMRKSFVTLSSPVWTSLGMECRLSDLVVFDANSARGRGPLSETFQQVLADEQRPTLVVRAGGDLLECVAVAWDGGKEASRAARTALPLLQKAGRVVILAAGAATTRAFEPQRLQAFLAARGVQAEVKLLSGGGDPAHLLLDAARAEAAGLMVAGAYGHPRLQEFIFGGTTRSFLHAEGAPSLFLSH